MSSNKKDSAAAGGESHYTTASGREVRKTGKKNISEALAQLRAAREGGGKRTDQYQVSSCCYRADRDVGGGSQEGVRGDRGRG